MRGIGRSVPVLFLLTLLSTGCAAMFSGTSEQIHVRSEEPQTRFFLNERELGNGSSAVTTVSKNQLDRAVLRATKEGCEERSTPIATSFDGVSLLGVFVDFGIVSIVVVDWLATGAVTKASQTDFVLTPNCGREVSGMWTVWGAGGAGEWWAKGS